jgi:hypothetical protein
MNLTDPVSLVENRFRNPPPSDVVWARSHHSTSRQSQRPAADRLRAPKHGRSVILLVIVVSCVGKRLD